jgi:hypothetical protein
VTMPGLAPPTPAHHTAAPARERDPGIDAARAVAIAGVVGGHWLVTGLVVDDAGAWRQASPLAAMPALVPVSWLLQTLGLFFFAGGFAAARSTGRRRSPAALIRPLLLLLGSWTAALAVAAMLGTPRGTLRTIAVLVVSPLWFLLPYLALRLVTPVLTRLVDRSGPAAVAGPAIAVVAGSDAGLLPGWTAVPAAWSVPWVLGIALANGRRPTRDIAPAHGRRPPGAVLLLAGVTGMVVLVRGLGYPAAACRWWQSPERGTRPGGQPGRPADLPEPPECSRGGRGDRREHPGQTAGRRLVDHAAGGLVTIPRVRPRRGHRTPMVDDPACPGRLILP